MTTSGEVTFAPLADFQTEITVTLKYNPPAGALGEAVAKIFADPAGRLDEDLKNFKNYPEGRPTSGQKLRVRRHQGGRLDPLSQRRR